MLLRWRDKSITNLPALRQQAVLNSLLFDMQQRKLTFSILFYIKRKKLLKNGDAPVYMRVTVDGRFLEASLKRGVNPKVWNEKKQRSTGRDRLSLELNDYLDDTLSRLLIGDVVLNTLVDDKI